MYYEQNAVLADAILLSCRNEPAAQAVVLLLVPTCMHTCIQAGIGSGCCTCCTWDNRGIHKSSHALYSDVFDSDRGRIKLDNLKGVQHHAIVASATTLKALSFALGITAEISIRPATVPSKAKHRIMSTPFKLSSFVRPLSESN
eukprot:scpid109414/ scgid24537/ 